MAVRLVENAIDHVYEGAIRSTISERRFK